MGKYSNYVGVTKKCNRKYSYWQAQISKNGKTVYLGVYPTEIAAARAYNKEAMHFYHDRNRTNPLPGDSDYGIRPPLDSNRGAKKGSFVDVSKREKTSQFKGVYWSRQLECWRIDIQRYDLRYQESFDEEIEAAFKYDIIMLNTYGDKVKYLNFLYTINDTNGIIVKRGIA